MAWDQSRGRLMAEGNDQLQRGLLEIKEPPVLSFSAGETW